MRNAARLLRAFTPADRGMEVGISELARRLDLGTSTVHRIVTTLVSERLLERGTRPGKYRLGLAMYEIGTQVSEHVDLHQAALPGARDAAAHDRRDGAHRRAGRARGRVRRAAGEPPHDAGVPRGRAPAAGARDVLGQGAARRPAAEPNSTVGWRRPGCGGSRARTIVDRDALRAELDLVAERGWAENVEESHVGVSSVGRADPRRERRGARVGQRRRRDDPDDHPDAARDGRAGRRRGRADLAAASATARPLPTPRCRRRPHLVANCAEIAATGCRGSGRQWMPRWPPASR